MTTDRGRADVYAAEIAAFEGTAYEDHVPLAELQELAGRLCRLAWWAKENIRVVAARSDAASSSTRQRNSATPVIRLASPQMTPATVVHELAHALAGLAAGHGPLFRRAYVDLAGAAFGAEPARWLADEFAALRLPLARRQWPTPEDPPGVIDEPIAL